MNIHPLFVHFPIGILTLYTFFEFARVRYITKQSYYFELKFILVFMGTVAGFVATITGDMAEELASAGNNTVVAASQMALIERHALFAVSAISIFAILAGSYLFEYLKKQNVLSRVTKLPFLGTVSGLIQKSAIVLALLGLMAITIAGALGASMVYGADIDPIVTVLYDIFAP